MVTDKIAMDTIGHHIKNKHVFWWVVQAFMDLYFVAILALCKDLKLRMENAEEGYAGAIYDFGY